MEQQDGKVFDHDNNGHVDDPRNVEHRELGETAQGIRQAHEPGVGSQIDGGSAPELQSELDQQVIQQLEAHLETSILTSGPIPAPDVLKSYPPEVQQKIIEWHDREIKATFDDESKRQDDLVAAQVTLDKVGIWLSFLINFLIIGGSLIAFAITQNPNVFWSYTVLGATVIGNVVVNVNGKKGKNGDNAPKG